MNLRILTKTSALCAVALLFCHTATASAINILGTGDFPAQDISNVTGDKGLGDANVLAWLQAEAALQGYPAPTTAQSDYTGGPIVTGDYLVLHYGSGTGGTPEGGLVALYFDANQSSFAVPANGSGPNGNGGISFARLYDHTNVPDSGSVVLLFGMALLGIEGMRRKLVRN